MEPRRRQAGGCCSTPVTPELSDERTAELVRIAKALADPTRLRILDTLRAAAPKALCQCELTPLFEMTQPAVAKHLKILVEAGIVGAERRDMWTYYYPRRQALEELTGWLS
jgi:ArsR family transcriptional regulator, arsenate/arsenite/antimonite-responsive transcriptional repressor